MCKLNSAHCIFWSPNIVGVFHHFQRKVNGFAVLPLNPHLFVCISEMYFSTLFQNTIYLNCISVFLWLQVLQHFQWSNSASDPNSIFLGFSEKSNGPALLPLTPSPSLSSCAPSLRLDRKRTMDSFDQKRKWRNSFSLHKQTHLDTEKLIFLPAR